VRIRIAVVIVCAALTQPWAAAQMPQIQPFSSDVQFTTTHGGGGSRPMTGKLYVGGKRMRMDMAGPTGNVVVIINSATKATDILMPEQHMYMEFTADMTQARRPGMAPELKTFENPTDPCADQPGSTCKQLGVEQVNGRACDHWQITDKNGKVTNAWIDQQVHFPIKIVSPESTYELSNVKEGAPAASLFEIPAGYHKMDFGGMMQGARPPQQ
jgi:hypothetical protein